MEMIRTYFTYEELMKLVHVGSFNYFEDESNPTDLLSLEDICNMLDIDWETSSFVKNGYATYLGILYRRLISRWHHYGTYCGYLDGDYSSTDKKNLCFKVTEKILAIMQQTQETYGEWIARYEKMLKTEQDKITATTTTQFNDTPTASNDYSADNFTTNITKTSTAQELDAVARYNQIKKQIYDVYSLWMREFKGLEIIVD